VARYVALMRIRVIHENDDWLPPFAAAFDAAGLPWEAWHIDTGVLALDTPPPPGVYWSRMSASSHTRGHLHAKDHTRSLLSWLEGAGATVVNGRRVLELEMSKVDQHAALRAAGLAVPRTFAVVGEPHRASEVARRLDVPFICKHNQGGKGLGVQRFDTHAAFDDFLATDPEPPIDGTLLLQEYLVAAEPRITRVEIVGGEFLYALNADTSAGFELCPADVCAVDDAFCPTDGTARFSLRRDFDAHDAQPWVDFARAWGIGIGGFEFIETVDGRRVTYDINTNTNYNPDVEAQAPRSGPAEIARYLGRLLADAARDGSDVLRAGV
jgi:hypothetical protein